MTASQPHHSQALIFEVTKAALDETRVVALDIAQELSDNEVLLKIDKFALTANNISYGIAGEALGYWRFFPTEKIAEQEQWGRLPVMGFADVVSSNCQHIKIGERVWGFMPMATHVKIVAGMHSNTGFADVSPHRAGLPPVYSTFERVSKKPFYQVDNEDFEILVRGLFMTSWLVDDFMFDNRYFDAKQYLITSASSKTSIALAFSIKERGELPCIGITSAANKKFVESLGCYQRVISYDEVANLDASISSLVVDMAGSQTVLAAIHRHFDKNICYSCRIGVTHHDDIVTDEVLPGAKPIFFFATTQLKKRTADWGSRETMKKLSGSLLRYIEFCRSIITIKHTTNKNDLVAIYKQVLSGKADASVGHIVSL
ncbi:MAG: DUF2855 family protein [Alteromonadaceae bacterium]|nr:DUF2855 family protein [Alteromonadaceae bacterium]